jgi:hypothetical protein
MLSETPTAPICFVVGCDKLSALTDVARGRFWVIEAHYCAECYTALANGEERKIDQTRLALRPLGESRVRNGT